MTPALPNISPPAGADSMDGGETKALPGQHDKSREPFEHLMTRAMSPDPKNAVADANDFPPAAKNSKPGTPASAKDSKKKSDDISSSGSNPSAPTETIAAAIIAENVPVQIVAPAVTMTDNKNESSAEPVIAGNPAEILTDLTKDKKSSSASTKVAPSAISSKQPDVSQSAEIKTDVQEKITAAVTNLAAARTILPDSKHPGTPTSSPQVPSPDKNTDKDSSIPMLADKSVAQPQQPGLASLPNFQEKSAPQPEPEKLGTSVAQQVVPMKKMGNNSETAMSAGKNLPGAAISAAAGKNLPPAENAAGQVLWRGGQLAATAVADSSSLPDMAQPSADPASLVARADFRSRTLDRVQDMVALHAARLGDSGDVSLQVVLKPGAGTQLSLELRQRGDGVEAQAVLQRGDFAHLNQQWPALQQQLEQRGIRLAPLADDASFAGGDGSHNFEDKHNQPEALNLFPAGAFAGTAPAGLEIQTAAGAGTHRGWQSWA